MRVEVYKTGDQFVAYDDKGVIITDRNILDQISFDQMPAFKISYYVNVSVDTSQKPAIINKVNINTRT